VPAGDAAEVSKIRPLPWTKQREDRFWTQLRKREQTAIGERVLEGRVLSTEEYQRLWHSADLRPSPVMVWMPEHTGRFLDFIESERLYALFALTAYCGLRRDEVLGLTWSEVDLDEGVAYVREAGTGDGPKSEAGVRAVPLPSEDVVAPLRSWRAVQAADQLAWGRDWPGTDLVFTREDGTPDPGQWVSTRFETLAFRAGFGRCPSTTCGTAPPHWPRPRGSTPTTSQRCLAMLGARLPMTPMCICSLRVPKLLRLRPPPLCRVKPMLKAPQMCKRSACQLNDRRCGGAVR
jgi:integrase